MALTKPRCQSLLKIGLMCGFLLLWAEDMNALSDFSKYLSKIISTQSAYGCDGEKLRLHCPRHSTVSILSADYGLADIRLCPSFTLLSGQLNCSASTAFQKLLTECQGHRDCSLLVNHHVFGRDPCPGSSKYLYVTYKCKPTEHKRKVGCEGDKMTLHCKPPRVLLIYSAVYGREEAARDLCPSQRQPPPFDCLYFGAAHTVLKKCYGKQRCSVTVNNETFRDPCPPKTTKYLTIIYTCVPLTLMKEADPNLFHPPYHSNDTGTPEVKGSKLQDNHGIIVSNSLMTYGYLKEHKDRAALLFVSSVCVGLLLLLLAVSLHVSCHSTPPAPGATTHSRRSLLRDTQETREEDEEEHSEDDEEDSSSEGSLAVRERCPPPAHSRRREGEYLAEAAEIMERIERRELVIQEIWMNSHLNGTTCGLP